MPHDTSALAFSVETCHNGRVRRLRDFASIVAMLGDREIDEMQAAIDGRREARDRPDTDRDGAAPGSRSRPDARDDPTRAAG